MPLSICVYIDRPVYAQFGDWRETWRGESSVEQHKSEAMEELGATYYEDPFRDVFRRRFIKFNACAWEHHLARPINIARAVPAFLISLL